MVREMIEIIESMKMSMKSTPTKTKHYVDKKKNNSRIWGRWYSFIESHTTYILAEIGKVKEIVS